MENKNNIPLRNDEILFLKGDTGTVGIVKLAEKKMIFLGTPDNDEIVQFLDPGDLIAVSAFGLGEKYEKGIKSLIYITRDMDAPIIVLPKNHPSSKRLSMVISVGENVRLDCNITPGTHPEQDILCSCAGLTGLEIKKSSNGVCVIGNLKDYKIEKF
jgi:hypothetical protein